MTTQTAERRSRRSKESALALRYQLEHSREKGRLEALIVTDRSGLLVASVGAETLCEELSAMASVFGRTFVPPSDLPTLEGGEIAIRSLTACGESFYLASLGGGVARDAVLESTRAGVSRILAAN